MGRWVYPLSGIVSIPASTWTVTYRAMKSAAATSAVAHCDIDILIRKSDNTVRTIIATNVANSPPISLTNQWETLTGTYDWPGYTVVDQTDYLEVAYYIEVTNPQTDKKVRLRWDDGSLPLADQTKIENVMFTYVNQAPVASFTYSPPNPAIFEQVTFDASASHDPDGSIISYTWDFGDGNITTVTNPIITHVYTTAASTVDYTVTVSEPQDIVNGYKFDHYDPSQSVTMTTAKTITLVYREISPLSVSISPLKAKIKIGESVTFTSSVSGGLSPYSYQWYLNGSAVSGATSSTWTFTPTATGYYIVYLKVTDGTPQTVKSNEASVTVASPLRVSISPMSASIVVGQSVAFTSTVSGGYPPYSYQWYLNDVAVSGATSSSWTFKPTASGIYYVYLKVVDANNNVVQSEVARVSVTSVPVGGYSVSLVKQTPASSVVAYAFIIVLSAVALGLAKHGGRFLGLYSVQA